MGKQALSVLVFTALNATAFLLPAPASAAWPSDPLVNVPLCAAAGDQRTPSIVADGVGGAIVAWTDGRTGSDDVYVQRVSASGVIQWNLDGVALCLATGQQANPTLVSDGAGGAIVAWHDLRGGLNYRVYAQRVSATGTPQWAADGVELTASAGDQLFPTIISDGAGGAIVTWYDARAGAYDIWAQRIAGDGSRVWADSGVAVCIAPGIQDYSAIASDGAGGAIITWSDMRSGSSYLDFDIYAQHVNTSGAVQWGTAGLPLCVAAGSQQSPMIIPDRLGGAIVTWFDGRGADWDVYAQSVSAAGIVQWTADGLAVCVQPGEQAVPTLAPDGAGGAIFTWRDYRNGLDYDIEAQRVSEAGTPQWTANGIAVCSATGDQYDPTITADGTGGAIVSWYDVRSGGTDIYAQHLAPSGTPTWTADGVAVCTAAGTQNVVFPCSDGAGGAILAWADRRSGGSDVYAQRVKANGQLGGDVASVPPATDLRFALEPMRPNPVRGSAMVVRFALPDAASASLELLDVSGRLVAARDVGSLGAGTHALDLAQGRTLAPGLYFVSLRRGPSTRVTRAAVLE